MTPRHSVPRVSLVARIRQAASTSMLVRSVLLGTMAIGVTVGGVLAGALVVAPVVARATQPSTMDQATRFMSGLSATMLVASRTIASRGSELAANAMTNLPQPMTRFALPGLAVIAIVGALSTLFLRRRTPVRSHAADLALEAFESAGVASSTPRSGSRANTKRNQTPRAVEAMAASGATMPDIAWKTGLPIDAVRLLLAISTGTRQFQPPAA